VADAVQSATRAPARRGQVRPSATAEITCAQRAAETLLPDDRRLLDDPYARHFLRTRAMRVRCATPTAARLTLSVFDRRYPGFMAVVLLRQRWYEEVLASALADGIDQVVLLGAGYDTTSLRLDLGGARLFEVDAAPTQDAKRSAMTRLGLRPAADVTYVACDFERDDLPAALAAAGFDATAPSLVVWYGVSFFLSEQAVRQTVEDVARTSAPGSRFLWDYLDADVVSGTTPFVGARRARAAVARRGEPYTFGLAAGEERALLEPAGFDVRDHVRIRDLAQRYGGRDGIWCSDDDFVGILTAERRP
jgi:methyltransferase (TIGR00027 family)